jgi:hypothetical protein
MPEEKSPEPANFKGVLFDQENYRPLADKATFNNASR